MRVVVPGASNCATLMYKSQSVSQSVDACSHSLLHPALPTPHMCLPLVARAQQKQVTISQGDAHSHQDARGHSHAAHNIWTLSAMQCCSEAIFHMARRQKCPV
ncbi:hypothetical protein E2C01_005806 [Portunus trituberculatus]|uniref:Uncharacterized protein n=1 Tax=Portunus trituberculatus TaxID=210409 RepID=A0A5B7CXK6_PORTR|nr:hypothetical protein [Portunus trituberculatus]